MSRRAERSTFGPATFRVIYLLSRNRYQMPHHAVELLHIRVCEFFAEFLCLRAD
jgi:hypothetical protein